MEPTSPSMPFKRIVRTLTGVGQPARSVHVEQTDEPYVSVRDIREIDSDLFNVTLRTSNGKTYSMIIARSLVSTGNIQISAQAIATLAWLGRL